MADLFDGYGATATKPRASAQRPPAWDEMFDAPGTARASYREIHAALAQMTQDELRGRTEALASSYLAQGVTFDFAGEERPFPLDAVPRVIAQDEWATVEAGVKQRVRALEAFLADVYGPQHAVRDGVIPAGLITLVQPLPPPGRGHRAGERRAHPGLGHRPDPRRARRLAGARGQRAGALRRQLRHLEPPRDGADAARAVRLDAGAPGRRLPEQAAAGAARVRPRRGRRPDRRRAHARRLQLRLLRAHAARPPDGRRARRGPRPVLLRRPGVDAHHRRPDPRRRDLPPRRRRVPRPAAVPRRLDARQPGPDARRAPRQRHDRERGRQRRRRRQARLHVRARPHPLLPRRGADPQERRHLAARGPGRARGGARPPRRARRQAGRRLGRQGPRRRAGGLARGARRARGAPAARPARLDRAAGRAALDDPDARRGRHAAAPRRPAAVRGERRQGRLGAARRPHPRRAARGPARRQSSQGGGSKDTWVVGRTRCRCRATASRGSSPTRPPPPRRSRSSPPKRSRSTRRTTRRSDVRRPRPAGAAAAASRADRACRDSPTESAC